MFLKYWWLSERHLGKDFLFNRKGLFEGSENALGWWVFSAGHLKQIQESRSVLEDLKIGACYRKHLESLGIGLESKQ